MESLTLRQKEDEEEIRRIETEVAVERAPQRTSASRAKGRDLRRGRDCVASCLYLGRAWRGAVPVCAFGAFIG